MQATSNFDFLKVEYPNLAKFGMLAERNAFVDPSTSLVKLRLLAERITEFIFKFEQLDDVDHLDQFHRILRLEKHEIIPTELSDALHTIRKAGNGAAHDGKGSTEEVRYVLRQAVKLVKWFCTMYDDILVPANFIELHKQDNDSDRIKELEQELAEATAQIIEYQKKIHRLSFLTREQKEERRIRASHLVREIHESESEIRHRIDFQLRKEGWDISEIDVSMKQNGNKDPIEYISSTNWPDSNEWNDSALFLGMKLEKENKY